MAADEVVLNIVRDYYELIQQPEDIVIIPGQNFAKTTMLNDLRTYFYNRNNYTSFCVTKQQQPDLVGLEKTMIFEKDSPKSEDVSLK